MLVDGDASSKLLRCEMVATQALGEEAAVEHAVHASLAQVRCSGSMALFVGSLIVHVRVHLGMRGMQLSPCAACAGGAH